MLRTNDLSTNSTIKKEMLLWRTVFSKPNLIFLSAESTYSEPLINNIHFSNHNGLFVIIIHPLSTHPNYKNFLSALQNNKIIYQKEPYTFSIASKNFDDIQKLIDVLNLFVNMDQFQRMLNGESIDSEEQMMRLAIEESLKDTTSLQQAQVGAVAAVPAHVPIPKAPYDRSLIDSYSFFRKDEEHVAPGKEEEKIEFKK